MSLYRGAGGASDATDDSTVNAVAGYASAAASSASAAATSATEASNSATASASSASSAATSASSVATNATNAANSAALAANSAALALTYRGSAFTNRNLAQTAAGNASVSEANAATSAASAATSATNAENSRIESSNILTDNMAVRDATLAIYGNTTAMNNAVTAAATSATTATTQATNAASSAALASAYSYAANAAVSGASSYADSAQNSANDAQAYATSALSARDATLAAYDSFDDRYLGVKSADPTVDNDGNPLIAGSLYFNNQTNMMMLRAGNAWVAAYTSGGSPSFGNTVVNGTLGVTGATTLSGGTANGVAYLNASKVLTSGSELVFNGTNLGIGTSSPDTSGKLTVAGTGGTATIVLNRTNSGLGGGKGALGWKSTNGYFTTAITEFTDASSDDTGSLVFRTMSGSTVTSPYSVTERMRLDSSGNLGLGVTPSAWGGNYKASEVKTSAVYDYLGTSGGLVFNAYYNGTNWVYKGTGGNAAAIRYEQDAFGSHRWFTAPSGTAGNAISFTQAMTLNASGNLGIGTSSPSQKLEVAGSVLLNPTNPALAFNTLAYQVYKQGTSLRLYANSIDHLICDGTGNVGIGTSSPQRKLEVSGAASGETYQVRLGVGSSNSAYTYDLGRSTIDGYFRFYGNQTGATGYIFGGIDGTRMTLDSSGNLGLGVTPSAWYSSVKAIQVTPYASLWASSADVNTAYMMNAYIGSSGSLIYTNTGVASSYQQYNGQHRWFNAASGTAGTAISFTQAMTLDASGNLLVGGTTSGNRLTVTGSGSSDVSVFISPGAPTGVKFARFSVGAGLGTEVGSVSYNGSTGVNYNTSSDYRLKENIQPMTGALAKIAQLKPVTYTWKKDGSAGEGFIAHELQEVCHQAVTGEKDAVDADGKPVYQGIDTSFLVATLTAAIQEQQAIINDLLARVAQLESN